MISTGHSRPKPRNTLVFFLVRISYLLMISGVLALGYAASVITIGQTYQHLELAKLRRQVPTAEPHIALLGETLGELQIPSVGLHAVVLHGASGRILRLGVGHLPASPMPGQPGNVVLAAHRDTFFRPLRAIRPGDDVILRSAAGTFIYQVESTSVASPQQIDLLRSSHRNELTLVTCFPFDFVGPAPSRFVVRASEVRRAAAHETANRHDP